MSEAMGEKVPDLWPDLADVWNAYHRLGRDFNGRVLYTEQLAFVNQLSDEGERELYLMGFDVIDSEHDRQRAIDMERD